MNGEDMQTPVSRFVRNQLQSTSTNSPCLKIPSSPLLTTLGYGTGVNVYLVERSPRHGQFRSPWAIKKISKVAQGKKIYSERLKNEADIIRSLSHPNIVGFRALVKSEDGTPCLALEDGQKSLFSIIEVRLEEGLDIFPSCNIMRVASDMVNALSYLHNTKKLLHGDMKSGNILIKGDFKIAKLCDFGVSVKLDENMSAPSSKYIGTESWSSKEAIDEGTRPELPDHTFTKDYHKAIEVFFICSNEDQKMRPSALQVQDLLAVEIQKTLTFE